MPHSHILDQSMRSWNLSCKASGEWFQNGVTPKFQNGSVLNTRRGQDNRTNSSFKIQRNGSCDQLCILSKCSKCWCCPVCFLDALYIYIRNYWAAWIRDGMKRGHRLLKLTTTLLVPRNQLAMSLCVAVLQAGLVFPMWAARFPQRTTGRRQWTIWKWTDVDRCGQGNRMSWPFANRWGTISQEGDEFSRPRATAWNGGAAFNCIHLFLWRPVL